MCIVAAYRTFPPTVDLLKEQSRWGQGYRFDFQVIDGRCVAVDHTEKPFEWGDSAVFSVENFGTPVREGPPLLGWLWKPRTVGLEVRTRQTIIWPEQAGGSFPEDVPAQLAAIVEAAIELQRDSFGTIEGLRLQLARELCLPVGVTPTSGSVDIPRAQLSKPVPRLRLIGVRMLTGLGMVGTLIGAWFVASAIRSINKSSRRGRNGQCEGCGYHLESLVVCPECGRLRSQPLSA
jgi:hypothetical protein